MFLSGGMNSEDELQKEIVNMLSEDDHDGDGSCKINVPNISPHITSYFLSTATVLIQNVCPADSLPPAQYGSSISKDEPESMIHVSLLKESLRTITDVLGDCIIPSCDSETLMEKDEVHLNKYSQASLIQPYVDVSLYNPIILLQLTKVHID